MSEYNSIKLFFKSGFSVEDIHKKFPHIGKGTLYKYLKLYNLEKYKQEAKNAFYHMPKYKEWREAVFKRDGYKCVICKHAGSFKNPLQADHHPYPKARYPEKMFDVDNGRTLCLKCHRKTISWKTGKTA